MKLNKEDKQLIELLQDLVRIRSDVSENRDESAVSDYIESFFANLPNWNLVSQTVKGKRRNLIATTSNNPKIVILGHQDTVPVTDSRQLKSEIKDGKLYGRGAVDMKSGLAVMLLLAKQKAWEDVAFVFTVDEEYHFAGVKKFIENNDWSPEIILNPEPTNLKIIYQCRGFTEVELVLRGKSAHAGRKDQGVNVIENTVKLSFELEKLVREKDSLDMTSSVNLAALHAGVFIDNEIKIRPNVVPDYAKVVIELRIGSPELTPKLIKDLVEKAARKVNLKIEDFSQELWFGPMTGNKKGLTKFEQALKNNKVRVAYMPPDRSGFYETQILQEKWNCLVAIFGPSPFEKSHQSDEYVELESVKRTYQILRSFLKS